MRRPHSLGWRPREPIAFLTPEERPLDSINYGPWAGGQFANMVKRHMVMKMRYPDRKPILAVPYEGMQGLRPETRELLRIFSLGMQIKK